MLNLHFKLYQTRSILLAPLHLRVPSIAPLHLCVPSINYATKLVVLHHAKDRDRDMYVLSNLCCSPSRRRPILLIFFVYAARIGELVVT